MSVVDAAHTPSVWMGEQQRGWAQGADLSPEEVTRLNMDKSALLGHLIDSQYGAEAVMLLGELQVSNSLCARS